MTLSGRFISGSSLFGTSSSNFLQEEEHQEISQENKSISLTFTEEDEEILFEVHAVQGNRWASIAKKFPGRTDNAVKNHFHVIMARHKREGGGSNTSYTLPSLYNLHFWCWHYRTMHTQDSFHNDNPDLGSSSAWNDRHGGHFENTSLVGLEKNYTFHRMSNKSSLEDGLTSNLVDVGGENENDNVTFFDFLRVGLHSH